MQAKSVLYAAVGAPVVAARKVGHQVTTLRHKLGEEAAGYGEAAGKAIDSWAEEGERVVSRLGHGKVAEEISAKVDLDQAREQVGKLRDQLENMLDTWRTSFRPEKAASTARPEDAEPAEEAAAETTSAKPAASKGGRPTASGAKKTTTTKASAAGTTKSSTAAKTSPAKPPSASKADKAS